MLGRAESALSLNLHVMQISPRFRFEVRAWPRRSRERRGFLVKTPEPGFFVGVSMMDRRIHGLFGSVNIFDHRKRRSTSLFFSAFSGSKAYMPPPAVVARTIELYQCGMAGQTSSATPFCRGASERISC